MSEIHALDNDQGGLLSDAALSALNLHHQPFTSELRDVAAMGEQNPEPAAPFSDPVTEEQISDIKQALITGDDLLLILGEEGAGKTTLLQQLNDNSGLRIQCFSVAGSERFSTLNLFSGMLEAFKRSPPDKLKDILDDLIPCLQSMAGRNTLSTVVLDDAHKVNQSELTQLLSSLLYVNSQDETLMRVALAATIEFEESIPDFLPEGANLPYSSLTIEGFIPARAAAYLDYRLQLAGFDQEFPFTERDMASLVDHSDGKPGELHALTADVLNEKYGRLIDSMPQELMPAEEGSGFLQSRTGKLALGAVATVLIIGGLLLFMPSPERQQPPATVDEQTVASLTEALQPDAPQVQQIDTAAATNNTIADTPVPDTSNTTLEGPEITISQDTTASQTPANAPQTDELSVAQSNDESSQPAVSPTSDAALPDNTLAQGTGDEPLQVVTDTDLAQSAAADVPSIEASTELPDQTASSITTETQSIDDNQLAEVAATATNDTTPAAAPENPTTEPDKPTTESVNELSPAVTDLDPDIANQLESPTWILVQDESQYTVQMSASRDLESVQNFLRRNPLPQPNSIFSFERNGEVWFALVHGIFPSLADARQAVERMSPEAQRDQPWIRSVGRIKSILR